MRGWQFYQTDKLALVPYMPGTPVYRDGVLPDLYKRTKAEGKIETVFCGDVLSMDDFVTFFTKRKTMQVLCEVEPNKDIKPVGYSWLDLPRGVDGERAAMCAFCFFEEAVKHGTVRDLARLGLGYWFGDMGVNVLHGVMLESNIPARNFSQKLGFRECAIVPKYHYDSRLERLVSARVMILEEDDFMPGFEEWKLEQDPVVV
jgi:hypothetical protein